jgi:hypothetical protein
MKLKLEIEFANKEELVSVAQALAGLNSSTFEPSESQEEEYEEVESPFKPESLVPSEAPKAKDLKAQKEAEKAALKAQKEAEKAALKAQKDAEEAQKKEAARIAMEEEKKRILAAQPEQPSTNVYEEIKALGDKLMAIPMPIEQKQAIINSCIARVNGPQGVPPSQYPLNLAAPFKDLLAQEVNALMNNKPMTGLV